MLNALAIAPESATGPVTVMVSLQPQFFVYVETKTVWPTRVLSQAGIATWASDRPVASGASTESP